MVVQMAKENGWGLGRIIGELKNLGLKSCRGHGAKHPAGERLRPGAQTW